MTPRTDSLNTRSTFTHAGSTVEFFRLPALSERGINLHRLPFCIRILLENLLRREDGRTVTESDIRFLCSWSPVAEPSREIAFVPSRVLMQDFTGIPAIVDLAAMRDAMLQLGGDPDRINPLQPAELVIDHSVQVDEYGTKGAYDLNAQLDFQRNRERYSFLKWGQAAFHNFSVIPSGMGICHQVNLEHLARIVFMTEPAADGAVTCYPDTLIGTDSHTTMINGLGVLGWGAGGIEAEAAMLGQPVSMLIPQVVGLRLTGKLKEGTTATDLVLTVTEMLRKHGVVGKFVEFYGPSVAELPVADRATIANMAPEYGATCGIFPVDDQTLKYLRLTGRDENHIALVERYYREQGLFHTRETPEAEYSASIALDLSSVKPSVAGPKRPQDRVTLSEAADSFAKHLPALLGPNSNKSSTRQIVRWEGEGGHASLQGDVTSSVGDPLIAISPKTSVRSRFGIDPEPYLDHGSIVIAAITSCTSTSNPYVMMAAGLVAKKAVERGLSVPPWVKTSLAPGSRVVTDYYVKSGLMKYLDRLRFNVVGYGCTVCIGNAGALLADVSEAIEQHGLVAVSVLSGNRNFEGRISPEVRANYLMSPPLVVAYALAGHICHNFETDPLGFDQQGAPVYLRDIWPTQAEVSEVIATSIDPSMYRERYATITDGDQNWQRLQFPVGQTYRWESDSTYIQKAPYFEGMTMETAPVQDINGARILAYLGDSITTDHISPAGSIKLDSPAGRYLSESGVEPKEFNTYGSRRGNHEVMVRGTFANVRLRNKLVPGVEGGVTKLLPVDELTTIYEASVAYARRKTALGILAGKEYGSGSSRDWAAKGPRLLGIQLVIAESYERIHRSNLIGMGILPLQFLPGQSAESLGLTGHEIYTVGTAPGQLRTLLDAPYRSGLVIHVRAERSDGGLTEFPVTVRMDTPQEVLYYQHGGILPYVLQQLATAPDGGR